MSDTEAVCGVCIPMEWTSFCLHLVKDVGTEWQYFTIYCDCYISGATWELLRLTFCIVGLVYGQINTFYSRVSDKCMFALFLVKPAFDHVCKCAFPIQFPTLYYPCSEQGMQFKGMAQCQLVFRWNGVRF